jgi:predicted deacetylase
LAVHVSIHDVSPACSAEVEGALELCHAAGARPALLVVPNFHGQSPLLDDARFCARLRELQASGPELSDVAPDEGRSRVEQGERVLARAGLRVDGFVAPAWSMPAWLLPLLAERAYHFTEDHLRIYDPAAGRSRASVVLNWASRSPGRLLSTIAWCRAAKHARALVPARIAIHPGDMHWLALRREIERLLAWASGDFVATGAGLLSAVA